MYLCALYTCILRIYRMISIVKTRQIDGINSRDDMPASNGNKNET